MTAHCDLLVAKTDIGFVVRVQGSGTMAHSPALTDFVMKCFEQDPQFCVAVDLLACDYLDSTFLGCLLKLQRAGTGSKFQVVADDGARTRLLGATHLDAYLTLVQQPPKSDGKFLRIDAILPSERELGQHIMEAHQVLSEVPSDVASTFRKIAAELKRDLEKQDRGKSNLQDTVVLPTRPKA